MKHLLAAIAATLLVYIVVERTTAALLPGAAALFDTGGTGWLMVAFAGLTCFVAFTAGASISRGPFVLPAIALWLVFGIRFLNAGYRMQIAATPSAVDRYFVESLPLICATLAGTLLGVIAGGFLSRRLRTWVAK